MPKYETVDQCVQRIWTGFHEKRERDAKFAASLKGKSRNILVDITDGKKYLLRVVDGDLKALEELEDLASVKLDVTVRTSGADLLALFNKELHPVQAYLSKRIHVKAPFGDILLVKGMLG